MNKQYVSVVIPAVCPLEEVAIYQSYLASDVKDRVFMQFVYLSNGKNNINTQPSKIIRFDTHEVLHVSHDRYFSSCEENIYRIQDFISLLQPLVFLIGDDDVIDWAAFERALQFYHHNDLKTMAWNVTSAQLKSDGTYSTLPTLAPISHNGNANRYVKILLAGQVLDASIAHAALLSVYGPMYWAAYIGNHLYAKEALANWLQYSTKEVLCSQVYKQAQFFSSHAIRYGFFNESVVTRRAEEFLSMSRGTHRWGWLEDHRTAFGKSASFNMAHVAHLLDIDDTALFNLLMTASGLSYAPTSNEEQTHSSYTVLTEVMLWIIATLQYQLSSKSYYFPEHTVTGTLQDLRFSYLLLDRLLASMQQYPNIYEAVSYPTKHHMVNAVLALKQYLHSLNPSPDLIKLAHEQLVISHSMINKDTLNILNYAAFDHYLATKAAIGA